MSSRAGLYINCINRFKPFIHQLLVHVLIAGRMVDVLRCFVVISVLVGVRHASGTSKCPDLLPVPSDSSPAVLVGTARDVLPADKDGEYGVVLLLQQVINGQDVMKNILTTQDDLQR